MLSTVRARKSFALAPAAAAKLQQTAPWPIYMEMLQQLLQVHKPQAEPGVGAGAGAVAETAGRTTARARAALALRNVQFYPWPCGMWQKVGGLGARGHRSVQHFMDGWGAKLRLKFKQRLYYLCHGCHGVASFCSHSWLPLHFTSLHSTPCLVPSLSISFNPSRQQFFCTAFVSVFVFSLFLESRSI